MKRKLFITLFALICAFSCTLALSACNAEPEQTALQKAFEIFRKSPNMTITVTDNRVTEDEYNFTAFIEIDHSHNALHTVSRTKYLIEGEYVETVDEQYLEAYYDNGTITENIYSISPQNEWSKHTAYFESGTSKDEEIRWLTMCASRYIPISNGIDFCENEDDDTLNTSLEWIQEVFTQNENVFTADLYACFLHGNDFTRIACTATLTLDAQGRFETAVLDLGEEGNITIKYVYGNTTVIIPPEALN